MQEDFKTPGQLIESLLKERGWNQNVLATVLNMSTSTLNKLISGRQAVSAEIAISLEEVFGMEAAKFLALQQEYDLARARLVSRPDPQLCAAPAPSPLRAGFFMPNRSCATPRLHGARSPTSRR